MPPRQSLFVTNPDAEPPSVTASETSSIPVSESHSVPVSEAEYIYVDNLEVEEPQVTVRPRSMVQGSPRWSVVCYGSYEFIFSRGDDSPALASSLTQLELDYEFQLKPEYEFHLQSECELQVESHSGPRSETGSRSQSEPQYERRAGLQPRPQRESQPEATSLNNPAFSSRWYPHQPLPPPCPEHVYASIVDLHTDTKAHRPIQRKRGRERLRE